MMRYLLISLVSCISLFGVTIPTFSVSALSPGKVTFANGATFEIVIEGFFPILDWDINDPITFSLAEATRLPAKISPILGDLIVRFPVSMRNELKNSQVIGYLETAATALSPNTRIIQSIDMSERKMTLDDLSVWYFQSRDDVTAEGWMPGDYVVLGDNLFFDATVVNVSRGTLISVME